MLNGANNSQDLTSVLQSKQATLQTVNHSTNEPINPKSAQIAPAQAA